MLLLNSCASSCADVARGTRTGHALISVLTSSSRPFLGRSFLCRFFCVVCMSTHGRSGFCQAASASSPCCLPGSFPAGCGAGGLIWRHEDAEDVSYTLQAEIHTGRLFTFTLRVFCRTLDYISALNFASVGELFPLWRICWMHFFLKRERNNGTVHKGGKRALNSVPLLWASLPLAEWQILSWVDVQHKEPHKRTRNEKSHYMIWTPFHPVGFFFFFISFMCSYLTWWKLNVVMALVGSRSTVFASVFMMGTQ